MATLAQGGRINEALVDEEIERLRSSWRSGEDGGETAILESCLAPEALAQLDRFDQAQLVHVISACRRARTLSDAGRWLFDVSRTRRTKTNDADRLRKYLERFGLSWASVRGSERGGT
jgi:transcriptional regulatory protein RtcR